MRWLNSTAWLLLLTIQFTAAPSSGAENFQEAVIGPEGAVIYKDADFDAQVVGQYPPGKKIKMSMKSFTGKGGLGAFYKMKLEDGRTGYVTDVDVIPQFKGGRSGKNENPIFQDVEDARQRKKARLRPIFFTRYLGLGAGLLNFSERFSGQTYRSNVTLFNLRLTGPGVFSADLPIDFNLSFSPQPPRYYKYFSQSAPTGQFVFGDVSFLIPVVDGDDVMIYCGLGLMMTYTKFRVQVGSEFIDSQEVRSGVDGILGIGLRSGKWILRGDAKYYYERTQYVGYWASLQHEF